MSPELGAIIVTGIASGTGLIIAVLNTKKLNDVHIIVNSRYTELADQLKTANAKVEFVTQALADSKLISLQDRLHKLEEIKNGHTV
jgi:hypothetical protein